MRVVVERVLVWELHAKTSIGTQACHTEGVFGE